MEDKKQKDGIFIPLHRLHNIIVTFSKMYEYGDNKVSKDVEYLLFLIYQDVNKVEEILDRWDKEIGSNND